MARIALTDIKSHPLNLTIYGAPTRESVTNLMESMETLGQTDPIHVDGQGVVYAGHRRVAAAGFLGWEDIDAVVIDFTGKSTWEIEEYILGNNAQRVKSNYVRAAEYSRFLSIEQQRARQRMRAGSPVQNSAQGKSRELAASRVGWSHDTASKAHAVHQFINDTIYQEFAEQLLDTLNRQSVNAAWNRYQQITREESHESEPEAVQDEQGDRSHTSQQDGTGVGSPGREADGAKLASECNQQPGDATGNRGVPGSGHPELEEGRARTGDGSPTEGGGRNTESTVTTSGTPERSPAPSLHDMTPEQRCEDVLGMLTRIEAHGMALKLNELKLEQLEGFTGPIREIFSEATA